MYNLLHTSLRERDRQLRSLQSTQKSSYFHERNATRKKKNPRRSNNYEWNCSIKVWWCGLGEEGKLLMFFRDGERNRWRLFGAGNFQANTAGLLNIPLDQSHHWSAGDYLVTTVSKKQGHQGLPRGPLNTSDPVSVLCKDQEPWNNSQGAQSSCITRQEKQCINHFCSRILQLATQGCRKCWPEIVHRTCRSQKAIPSPQSLLLTSKD